MVARLLIIIMVFCWLQLCVTRLQSLVCIVQMDYGKVGISPPEHFVRNIYNLDYVKCNRLVETLLILSDNNFRYSVIVP